MIVVEVNGGIVTSIYSDDPLPDIILVDWDNIESLGEGEDAGEHIGTYPTSPLADMPESTRLIVESILDRQPDEGVSE